MPGDATWIHTFFNTGFWVNSGGDFAAPSSSLAVAAIGSYTWGSSAQLVADVQDWLDNPASNFGWVLVGDESTFPTSKRFDSSENPIPSTRPLLAVAFTVPGVAAGRVPDGNLLPGVPLTVEHVAAGGIRLSWSLSCLASDTDFEIYEGMLSNFYSHAPRFCSTGGALSGSFTPAAGSTYYLVVPRNATREGSYGTSSCCQRPQGGVFTCLDQDIGACP